MPSPPWVLGPAPVLQLGGAQASLLLSPDLAVDHPGGVPRQELPERGGHGHHPPALAAAGHVPRGLRELHEDQGGAAEEPAAGVRGPAAVPRAHPGTGRSQCSWGILLPALSLSLCLSGCGAVGLAVEQGS